MEINELEFKLHPLHLPDITPSNFFCYLGFRKSQVLFEQLNYVEKIKLKKKYFVPLLRRKMRFVLCII